MPFTRGGIDATSAVTARSRMVVGVALGDCAGLVHLGCRSYDEIDRPSSLLSRRWFLGFVHVPTWLLSVTISANLLPCDRPICAYFSV